MRIDPEFTISDWMKFMRLSHEPYAATLVSALRKARLLSGQLVERSCRLRPVRPVCQ
jgi:hypothetical protein